VRVWGSYFGEVIRRSLGGDWIVDQKEVFLQLGSRRLDPLGQVRSRIVIVDQKNVFLQLSSRRLDPLGQVRSRIVGGSLYNLQDFYKGIKAGFQNNQIEPLVKSELDKRDHQASNTKNRIIKNHIFIYIGIVFGMIILLGLCILGFWLVGKQGGLSFLESIKLPVLMTSPQ